MEKPLYITWAVLLRQIDSPAFEHLRSFSYRTLEPRVYVCVCVCVCMCQLMILISSKGT
jgi:hypothetical protein